MVFYRPFSYIYKPSEDYCYYAELSNTLFPVLWSPMVDAVFMPVTVSIYLVAYAKATVLAVMQILGVPVEFFLPSL